MADDFDFYDDFDCDANPFLAPAEVLPAPTSASQGIGDADDGDAVQELLKQLQAAKDSGLDAEFGADFDFASALDEEPTAVAKSSTKAAASSAATEKEYWYNPVTNRWETRDTYKEGDAGKYAAARRAQEAAKAAGAAAAKRAEKRARERQEMDAVKRARGAGSEVPRGAGSEVNHRLRYSYKTDLCWQFKRGTCKKGDKCYWAHGEAELRGGGDAETLKERIVAECVAEARSDSNAGMCEYPQALVVRLALRFEDKPDEMLASMAKAGLPAGADRRTTVKALTRLCHPDKCHHPEAKKAMQILGPLLTSK